MQVAGVFVQQVYCRTLNQDMKGHAFVYEAGFMSEEVCFELLAVLIVSPSESLFTPCLLHC